MTPSRTDPKPWLRSLALLPMVAVVGCFGLSRNAPPVAHYVLSGARTPIAASTSDASGLHIGLRRLELAPYLTNPAIVMRRGAHGIETSAFHRWGEELSEGINHTIAAYLQNQPPVLHVYIAPWPTRARHDYLVQLRVSRFEGVVGGTAGVAEAHIISSWDIIRPDGGTLLVRGTTEYRGGAFRAGDYDALVGELNVGLRQVAEDVRACLARVRADSLPSCA
jgi:uncharacterized lipoprotein YmbA